MQDFRNVENEFITGIKRVVEDNISNDKFGVSELANEIGMSRSNLLRKVQKLTNLSVSQFIRQIRLENAMEILKQSSVNVSEVAYQVGFSSTSYFIKCFREHYGYPPGEVGKKEQEEIKTAGIKKPGKPIKLVILVSAIIIFGIVYFVMIQPYIVKRQQVRTSIAVLPFRNDSNDSTNVYVINGLMEAVLSNLQKIEDVNVISRTSVEKYRNTEKSIREIRKELNVYYIIEGSGQKIGDEILLNIQLIDAEKDSQLWAEQYRQETKDIFQLQIDVAKNIAEEIKVIITPEEEERINKIPTNNLVAYDYYLKGLDFYNKAGGDLTYAIEYYKKAIEHDPEFAHPYAGIAMCYYYIDLVQIDNVYTDSIAIYADKALSLDPELTQSLTAKALSFLIKGEQQQAIPYFEKALEYNPNSAETLNFLSEFYTNINPNTSKYLEYALKGIQLDITSHDSTMVSYIYLHVSNAFIQSGFVKEAESYINKSLDYNPENIFSHYVKAYILFAKNKDLQHTKEMLIETLQMDTTRLDVLQEVGKICYYMRDYESAYYFYKKFVDAKETYQLSIFPSENAKISIVYAYMGLNEKSEQLLDNYFEYAQNNQSIYKNLSLASYYSVTGNTEKALEHLRLFKNEDNYFYWLTLFLEMEPLMDHIKDHPEFKKINKELIDKFWDYHAEIRTSLKEKKLI